MTRVLFVRHGQAEHNLRQAEIVGGRSNHVPLTPQGQDEARMFGMWLKRTELVPAIVAHSGAVRTQQTCTIALAAAEIDIEPHCDPRFQEMSQGEAEGRLRSDVYTPEVIARLAREGLHGKHAGGESLAEVQQRMHAATLELCDQLPTAEGTILVFSHGLAIRALAGALLGLTRLGILTHTTPNVSVTAIDQTDTGLSVAYIGKTVIEE